MFMPWMMEDMDAAQSAVQVYGERLAESARWKGVVGSLPSREAANTAILLQNQFAYNKQNQPQMYVVRNGKIDETTKVVNVGHFDKFSLPVIRAVMPNLVANELVSVQPMPGPVSMVFFLDYILGTTKGNQSAGTVAFDSRTGPINTEFYSQGIVPSESKTFSAPGAGAAATVTLAYTPVRPGTLSGSVTFASGATTVTFTDDGNGGIIFSTGSTNGDPANSSITYSSGVLVLDAAGGQSIDANSITVSYEFDTEASDQIPQVDLQITSAPIVAMTRKLRSRYSLEAAQNLNALHGIDADSELTGIVAELIKHEQDRQIINQLYNFAQAGNVTWDKAVPAGIDWVTHKLTLVDAFAKASNYIYSATKRGNANWAVVGMNWADVIETLPSFTPLPGALGAQQNTGVVKIGTLNNRWTIYKDPYLPADRVLLGYKGSSMMDTGYIFSPYIPLYTTPTVILDDFISRKGTATQYGVKPVNSNFYATLQMLNAS